MAGHDMVRRMDRWREVLRWCRRGFGYARQRVGPKLMNRRKPETAGTREIWKDVEANSGS